MNVCGGGWVMTTLRGLKVGCAVVFCGLSFSVVADEPSATDATQGVWQKHEYSFQFLGFTSTYSCDGLASKLEVLLIAAGARADAKANTDACAPRYWIAGNIH